MSISGTLSIALSGLTAAQRSADVVSSNIANATTKGYGRRTLGLSSQSVGGQGAGVRVDGVIRQVDAALIGDRRLADAGLGYANQQADFYLQLEQVIGTPGDTGALTDQIAALQSALVEAASDPSSELRLGNVLTAAQNLTGGLNRISDEVQAGRMAADKQIDTDITRLNDTLTKIADLNGQIRVQMANGRDATGLMDQRQQQIDTVSQLVPIRTIQRDHGQVALYTSTGAQLVDGTASQFGFTPAGTIVPEMSIETGALSGLTLNGQPISVSGPHAPIAGGQLQALFDQRDTWATSAQTEIDALARDLIERFDGLGTAAGQPGLFTDAGAVLDPLTETGLSARISVNAAVDPDQGGAVWRLRSGLDALTPGLAGDSTLLNGFADALSATRSPTSGQFTARQYAASDLAGAFTAFVGIARQSAETDQSFAATRQETLHSAELGTGVDTDEELQKLLLIEQSYAANARVIQAADEMIQTLLRL